MWTAIVEDSLGNRRILSQIRDGEWYSAAVQLMDLSGKVISRYYHPGGLGFYGQVDIDGQRPLLLGGTNSSARFIRRIVPFETRRHCIVVALIDLGDLSGQGFPYSRGLPEERDWGDGIPPARERAYLLIPPINPDTDAYLRSVDLFEDPDSKQLKIQIRLLDGRIYRLDPELNPGSLYLLLDSAADAFQQAGGKFPRLLHLRYGVERLIAVPVDN
jgi:hypothetical protein